MSNVRIRFLSVTMTDSTWNPIPGLKSVDLGVDGAFLVPGEGIVLDEADFVFFAKRSGADGITVTRPDGSVGRFMMNTDTEGEEFLEGEVIPPAAVTIASDGDIGKTSISTENPAVESTGEEASEPAAPQGPRPLWVSSVMEFLHNPLFDVGDGVPRVAVGKLRVPGFGDIERFHHNDPPDGSYVTHINHHHVKILERIFAMKLAPGAIPPQYRPPSNTRANLLSEGYSLSVGSPT